MPEKEEEKVKQENSAEVSASPIFNPASIPKSFKKNDTAKVSPETTPSHAEQGESKKKKWSRPMSAIKAHQKFQVTVRQKLKEAEKERKKKETMKLAYYTLFYIILLIIYMTAGAWMFMMIEKKVDIESQEASRSKLFTDRKAFVQYLMNLTDAKNITEINAKLYAYEKSLVTSSDKIDFDSLNFEKKTGGIKPTWDYWNAVFFAGTVFTTIGYGNIAPATDVGRITCIIYACFGIPLCLVVLAKLGQLLNLLFKALWKPLKKVILRLLAKCKCCPITVIEFLKPSTKNEDDENDDDELLPIWLAWLITTLFIFFGAALYRLWEDEWSFLSSFYFIFISISTIGFGDITPGHPNYFMLSSLYMIVGLALVAMCINVMLEFASIAAEKARIAAEEAAMKIKDELDDSDDEKNNEALSELCKTIHTGTKEGNL